MEWLRFVFCFFDGASRANAAPPFASGVMGRALPNLFAQPPGLPWSVNVLLSLPLARHFGRFRDGNTPEHA